MSSPNALLTFSIGPVHAFISQARRVADVWAGSDLLSHLMGKAIGKARSMGGETVFPAVVDDEEATGIPNRVVCRVPLEDADEIARAMAEAVDSEWRSLASEAVEVLARHGIAPAADLWAPEGQEGSRQTDHVFESAWSWVSEEQGYAAASAEGASRYAASRLCRPFVQVEQQGEKCALCGERTALPDGDRGNVRAAWQTAAERAEGGPDERFLRFDQGRLCLVCATKRLYTRNRDSKRVYFRAFDAFDQEARGSRKNEGDAERAPYVALVNMDGDRMSEVLAWGPERIAGGKEQVEEFHRALSRALSHFATSLRNEAADEPLERSQLNLRSLELTSKARKSNRPQLIYAGGDDVLVVCAPADALPVARALQAHYVKTLAPLAKRLEDSGSIRELTLSGAILYAHGRYPAGAMFRDVQDLLKYKAKAEAGRNALALRLDKRGGVPVEVAFRWDEPAGSVAGSHWPDALHGLVQKVETGILGSTLTVNLRREERVLLPVLGKDPEQWQPWLQDRLGRSGVSRESAESLAAEIAPFFVHRKPEALRIARFLGRELSRGRRLEAAP